MIQKIFSNLGLSAIRVVGLPIVIRMWWGFFLNLPSIIRKRNLFPIDQYMSTINELKINGQYGQFRVRPAAIDKMIVEESTTFSSIRELYIRNCYFKFHDFDPREIKTVLDLGANRGLASTMFTPFAEKIVSIEANPLFKEVIHFNVVETNGFKDHHIGCFFVDRHQSQDGLQPNTITIAEIISKYHLDQIDFLKIDIEGSEFAIFDMLPFNIIRYLSMEVHPQAGSVADLIDILKQNSFSFVMANSRLTVTNNLDDVDYIYARNDRLLKE